jgi:hypothetical protein
MDFRMRPRRHAVHEPRRALALLLAAVAFAGCTPVMSTPPATVPGRVIPNESPLRFSTHAFGTYCYNTIGCKVVYNHKYQIEDDDDRVAPPPRADHLKTWGTREIGIGNFPPPAQVSWKSLDGVPHEASVDIGAIFADERILHHVPEQDIPEGWAHGVSPDIYLIVNDRTIEVYMRSDIATKQEQIPGNRYSNHRQETILVWTRSY